MQWLGLYKTLPGMILIEVAYTMPFATLVFRAFIASIPRELDEAAIMDGASSLRIFFSVILPLLKPAIITVIVISSVGIYNDFIGPLYFRRMDRADVISRGNLKAVDYEPVTSRVFNTDLRYYPKK